MLTAYFLSGQTLPFKVMDFKQDFLLPDVGQFCYVTFGAF